MSTVTSQWDRVRGQHPRGGGVVQNGGVSLRGCTDVGGSVEDGVGVRGCGGYVAPELYRIARLAVVQFHVDTLRGVGPPQVGGGSARRGRGARGRGRRGRGMWGEG